MLDFCLCVNPKQFQVGGYWCQYYSTSCLWKNDNDGVPSLFTRNEADTPLAPHEFLIFTTHHIYWLRYQVDGDWRLPYLTNIFFLFKERKKMETRERRGRERIKTSEAQLPKYTERWGGTGRVLAGYCCNVDDPWHQRWLATTTVCNAPLSYFSLSSHLSFFFSFNPP